MKQDKYCSKFTVGYAKVKGDYSYLAGRNVMSLGDFLICFLYIYIC